MSLFRCGRTATVQLRGFSSSSSLRVGPESPNFIDVPRLIQPDLAPKPRVKGTLPVPREIFPTRRVDKPNKKYIAAAAPAPSGSKRIKQDGPHAEYQEWKREMASMRRNHLREGLSELYNRKKKTDYLMASRSRLRQHERNIVLNQPLRKDELLTRPSVLRDMLPKNTPILPDPTREAQVAKSKERLEHSRLQKGLERQDSLHTLYVNARDFITTETQLAAEIAKVFPEGDNEAWRNDHGPGDNIWNLGVPQTVHSLVTEDSKFEHKRWDIIQDRVKKLGEQISGGKL
ncbi:hypothetical protein BJX99DRAFT_233452 [Aspergillus californicus]